jgi:hypothetical protein
MFAIRKKNNVDAWWNEIYGWDVRDLATWFASIGRAERFAKENHLFDWEVVQVRD